MQTFNYNNPIRVHFGDGVLDKELPAELSRYGKRVMLAYGHGSIKKSGLYNRLVAMLQTAGKEVVDFSGIMSNPTYDKVQEGARIAKEKHVDFILAVGGGSVSDCCKVVAAQAKTDDDLWQMEYQEHRTPTDFLPLGVIVTAGGTGSEENAGAVITNTNTKQKNGMLGALADFAILDPSLTRTLPMGQVVSGAFDTLSHCMETYFGKPAATNVSDEVNEAVMRNVIHNLRAIIANPDDDFARGELLWDAALAEDGSLKRGKQTDFQCHMLEHQLGAYTDCNHGRGLAVLHPVLYRHLYQAASEKFARFAREVWHVSAERKSDEQVAREGIDALAAFIKEIGLPSRLSDMGIHLSDDERQAIAKSTIITPGCCRQLTPDELNQILKEAE